MPDEITTFVNNTYSSTSTSSGSSNGSVTAETLDKLERQAQLYENFRAPPVHVDTLTSIKRYLKEVYSDVKFLSDEGSTYNCPDFVTMDNGGENENTQTYMIAQHLFEKLGELVLFLYLF